MKDKTTLQLAFRLNELLKEYDELGVEQITNEHKVAKLNEEWDAICYELWNRVPSLQTDVNLQPKSKKRVKEK